MTLHVITALDAGGTQRVLRELVMAERNLGYSVDVVELMDTGPTPLKKDLQCNGVIVSSLVMKEPVGFFRGLGVIRRLAAKHHESGAVSWLPHANLLTSLALIGLTTKHFWNVRNSNPGLIDTKLSTRLVYRLCAAVSSFGCYCCIYCAGAARAAYRRYGYHCRFELTIQNGVNLSRFQPCLSKRELNKYGILVPARFHPHKNLPLAVASAALVLSRCPDATVTFAGSGTELENQKFSELLEVVPSHLRSRVYRLGDVKDIGQIMKNYGVVWLTSTTEGFPNVLVEALACGLPVVSTNVGDAAEIIGRCGYVAHEPSPEAISVLTQAVWNGEGALGLITTEMCRQRAEQIWSLDVMLGKYMSILHPSHTNP